MKLQDLLENKKEKAHLAIILEEFEKKDSEKKEEDKDTSDDATSELLASLEDNEIADAKAKSDSNDSDDSDKSKETSDEDSDEDTDGDDSRVFTLSVVDVLDQKTVFVKMGKEAAKDDDDADAVIDEADVVEQIVDALGGKTEVTGTMESLKEDGIDLSDMLEYYEKELQEKIEASEELETKLGIEDTDQDEDEAGLHDELKDTGIMTGVEDADDSDEFPVEDEPSDSSYHLSTLDRHGVSPEGYNARLDFGADNMMDSMASLHPEARESEFYDDY